MARRDWEQSITSGNYISFGLTLVKWSGIMWTKDAIYGAISRQRTCLPHFGPEANLISRGAPYIYMTHPWKLRLPVLCTDLPF